MNYLGINIGGTNTSIGLGAANGEIIASEAFATSDYESTIARIIDISKKMIKDDTCAVGISCGGPLDPETGIVQSPPNLPDWKNVPIVKIIEDATGKPTFLMNDANAGALCEHYFGKGDGLLAAFAVAKYLSDTDPLDQLLKRFPELRSCKKDIESSVDIICDAFSSGKKLLLCGNGGSWADCEHIAGELLKSFNRPRPLTEKWIENIPAELAAQLEGGLPAIALQSTGAFASAYSNDVNSEAAFAQQVHVLGQEGDVLMAISTSGNSANIISASQVAKAKGLRVVGLTGRSGGKLKEVCETSILAPADKTHLIQEYHLPIYHAICMMIENRLFGGQ